MHPLLQQIFKRHTQRQTPSPFIKCLNDNCLLYARPDCTQTLLQLFIYIFQQEAFEKCWAHSPLQAASRPFTRCRKRYCRAPPAHRCPRQQRQRQRVTEGTAMAPWNGPNNHSKWSSSTFCC